MILLVYMLKFIGDISRAALNQRFQTLQNDENFDSLQLPYV